MYGFYIFCVQQMLGNISLVAFIMTRKSQPYGFTMWIKEMKNVLTEIIHVCKSAHGLPVIFKVFSHVKSFFCACLNCFTLHIKLFVVFFCPPHPHVLTCIQHSAATDSRPSKLHVIATNTPSKKAKRKILQRH